jgi:hypothetical protein
MHPMQIGKSHDVFDGPAQRDIRFRREQNATRTDIAGLCVLARMPGPGSHDAKR